VLRRAATGAAFDARILFAHAMVAGFLPEMFVRGLGYFSPTSLLLVSSLMFLYGQRRAAKSASAAAAGREDRPDAPLETPAPR